MMDNITKLKMIKSAANSDQTKYSRKLKASVFIVSLFTYACTNEIVPDPKDEVISANQEKATIRVLNSARKKELEMMLLHDCASCHGENLKGGMAPALLPANLRDKPKKYIVASILAGHPNTPMPAWSGILTEKEVYWIAKYLLERQVD